jgi:putative endonuclease
MGREHVYSVYMLASQRNGTLYIGVSSDLAKRCWQHKQGELIGFTSTYGVSQLVYYECFADVREAISHEKVLKKWRRAWKLALIERANPTWKDLFDDKTGAIEPLPGTVFQ